MYQYCRKFVIALVLGTGIFSLCGVAKARGLYFRNYTSEDIYLAVVNPEGGGWRADGWYRVRPGQKFRVISGGLNSKYYYYYAHNPSKTRVWRGSQRFWIHPTRRFLYLHINGRVNSLLPGSRIEGFRRINTGADHIQTYTVNLR